MMGGDDLDDGWAVETFDEGDDYINVIEVDDDHSSSRKRMRSIVDDDSGSDRDAGDGDGDGDGEPKTISGKAARRKASRQKRQAKFRKQSDGLNAVVSSLDPAGQAALFMAAMQTRQKNDNLTGIERGVYTVSDIHFEVPKLDATTSINDETNAMKKCRKSGFSPEHPHDLDHLASFVKALMPDWQSSLSLTGKGSGNNVKGTPTLVIITTSAVRGCNIIRSLKSLQCGRVGKLFSKHMKLVDQQKLLAETVLSVVVGTPNRIHKLLSTQSLDINETKIVLLDCVQDAKRRTLLELPEVSDDLFGLYQDYIARYIRRGTLKFAMY